MDEWIAIYAEGPSVTNKPSDGSVVMSTSMWLFFAVPVLLFIVILLVIVSCWCVIKQGRGRPTSHLPLQIRQTSERPQQKQQKQQSQLPRKFIVANSRYLPATVVNVPANGYEIVMGNGRDCVRSTDLENNLLRESVDKPTTKMTAVRLSGRFVVKLLEALSGQSRRQLDQTSTGDVVDRVETSSMIHKKTETRPEDLQTNTGIEDVKCVSCLRHSKDGTPAEEMKPNLRSVTFACP